MTNDEVLKEMGESLKALRTDHVDIWHLHGRDTPDAITDEAVEAQMNFRAMTEPYTPQDEKMLFARRGPSGSRSTTDFFLLYIFV
jgi:aryl-alcohol dehydrogenase-like predicted oxidoreductase